MSVTIYQWKRRVITQDATLSNMAVKNSSLDIISFVRRIVTFHYMDFEFQNDQQI
jgi:hypothetical protein